VTAEDRSRPLLCANGGCSDDGSRARVTGRRQAGSLRNCRQKRPHYCPSVEGFGRFKWATLKRSFVIFSGLELDGNCGKLARISPPHGGCLERWKLIFAQLIPRLPLTTYCRCVAPRKGEHKIKSFACLEQFLIMLLAQLTFREILRDIKACRRAGQEASIFQVDRTAPCRVRNRPIMITNWFCAEVVCQRVERFGIMSTAHRQNYFSVDSTARAAIAAARRTGRCFQQVEPALSTGAGSGGLCRGSATR
jgi:hypothetical protein